MSLDRFISPYVASQFPRIYREEGPAFIAFVKAYYEWMETSGQVNDETGKLTAYRDIDTTLDEFIVYFKNKYMNGIPEGILGDKRLLQKHIKEIYSSKGTERGLQLLFQLLIGEGVEVYYPGDDILKPSDGTWIKQQYVEVTANPLNALLVGEPIRGRESGATAVVEDFQTRYINRRHINILYLSNVNGTFVTGELLLNSVMKDPLKSPNVVGSLTNVLMNESGFDFKVGDVLEIYGGSGTGGQVVVAETANKSGVIEFTIENGGSGYTSSLNAVATAFAPNYLIINKSNNDSTGIGAEFKVGQLSNIEFIFASNTIIAPWKDTGLDAADYLMPGGGVETINTPIDQALTYMDLEVGTIKTLRAVNPGNNYVGPVTVDLTNPVVVGYNFLDEDRPVIKGANAKIRGDAAYGEGAIIAVSILDSGYGYQDGDTIELISDVNPSIAGGVIALGRHGHDAGRWRDTKSFLNSNKYIQDSFYYQDYSYETKTSMAFNQYSDILKRLWHPAGTELFGKISVAMEIDNSSVIEDAYIAQIYLTEYHTQFNTLIETNRMTASLYGTLFATTYSTTAPTLTTRSTRTSAYQSFQELIVNGSFVANTANWNPVSTTVQVWDSSKLKVTITGGIGATKQTINTIIGNNYYLAGEYSDATGTGGTLAVANSTGGSIVSVTKTGAANTFGASFVASSTTTDVVLTTNGVNGQYALWDNISVKALPTVSKVTFQDYETTFLTVKNTQFNTSVMTVSSYDTAIFTSYDTSKATQSLFETAFLTNRGTTTAFATNFNTLQNTLFLTDTLRTTFGVATRSTSTGYTTSYASAYDTSVGTQTTLITGLNTLKNTDVATSTSFSTNFATSKLTDTGAIALKQTYVDTSVVTSTTYTTGFATTFFTSRATATSRYTSTTAALLTETYKSTSTAHVTSFNTQNSTTTAVPASRSTGTSVATSHPTTTNFDTSRATDTTATTSTVYGTTTLFSTATSRLTSTSVETTRSTTGAASYSVASSSTPGSGSVTAPAGATSVTIYVWGGGGRGGGSNKVGGVGGGGGGGGGFSKSTYSISAGQTLNYTVGSGGSGGTVGAVVNGTSSTVSSGSKSITTMTGGGGDGGNNNGISGSGGSASGGNVANINGFSGDSAPDEFSGQGAPPIGTATGAGTFSGGNLAGAGHGGAGADWDPDVNIPGSPGGAGAVLFDFEITSTVNTTYSSSFNTTATFNTVTSQPTLTSKSTSSVFATSTVYNTSRSSTTAYVSSFNTTTNYNSSRGTTTVYGTNRATTKSTSTAFNTSTTFLTGTTAVFNTSTVYGTSQATSRSTSRNTNTTYTSVYNTSSGAVVQTTTAYNSTFNTSRPTSSVYQTTMNTMIGTIASTTTAYGTEIITSRDTAKGTNTAYVTNFETTFATGTNRNTIYDTARATSKNTNSIFTTVHETATTEFTSFNTSKNTAFGTTVSTSTVYDSALNTDAVTTGTTQTQILTTFVVVPTLYTTSFNTNTQRATDYVTARATSVSTETDYNTGYDTMYLTSLNTESDLL